MPGLGRWTPGYGFLRVVLSVLLLCLPSPFLANVFPNDVLSSLDKYDSEPYRYEHTAKAKTHPSVPFSSSPSSRTSSSSGVVGKMPLPVQASLTGYSYPFVPEGSVSDDEVYSDLFSQEDISSEPSRQGLLVPEEDSEEDYEDYSDYPQEKSQSYTLDNSPIVTSHHEADSASKPFKHHSSSPPSSPFHVENPAPIYDDDYDSQPEEDERAREEEGSDKKEKVAGKQSHHAPNPSKHKYHREKSQNERCPLCKLRDEDRAYRIESLKRKILNELHFTVLPNTTGIPVPKALAHMSGIHTGLLQDAPYGGVYQQYYEDEDQSEEDEYLPPDRVFITAKQLPSHLDTGNKNACYFSMPAEVLRSHVTKAYLWFYVRYSSDERPDVIQMKVNRLGPSFSKSRRSSRRCVWRHKVYPEKASGWKKVDMTNVIRRWVKHPSSNYGLEILAMDGNDNLAILPPTAVVDEGYEPTLDIMVSKKNTNRRYRRSDSLVCSENSTEHRCCRYPLSISFAEYGWEWIIAPTHVRVDYCSGECRMTLQNKTPYSWIASQTTEGGSCCTPSKMMALPLLYFDQHGDVVFQLLQDMRVERCGCA